MYVWCVIDKSQPVIDLSDGYERYIGYQFITLQTSENKIPTAKNYQAIPKSLPTDFFRSIIDRAEQYLGSGAFL